MNPIIAAVDDALSDALIDAENPSSFELATIAVGVVLEALDIKPDELPDNGLTAR